MSAKGQYTRGQPENIYTAREWDIQTKVTLVADTTTYKEVDKRYNWVHIESSTDLLIDFTGTVADPITANHPVEVIAGVMTDIQIPTGKLYGEDTWYIHFQSAGTPDVKWRLG